MFYYLGAFFMPIAGWVIACWLVRKSTVVGAVFAHMNTISWRKLSVRQKGLLLSVFFGALIMLELFWRMLFEFLIAYLQIRDALVQMSCL